MTSVRSTSDVATKGEPEKAGSTAKKPGNNSKFNALSVSLAFAMTGLIVVYLPHFLNSIDWKIEGRFVGIGLAMAGAGFTLLAVEQLTGRSGFGTWGFCLCVLVTAISGLAWALRAHHLPKWCIVVLTVLTVNLIFIAVFAIVSGFTSFFDEPEVAPAEKASEVDGEAQVSPDTEEKKLSSYERITLIVAVVSTIATLVAAIEPLVHP